MAEAIQLYSVASGVINANSNSGDLPCYGADSLDFHMNITAAAGTLQVLVETKGLDGIYYTVFDSTALGVSVTNKSIGPGLELAKSFGDTIRVRWVAAAGGATASISLTGRKSGRTNAP